MVIFNNDRTDVLVLEIKEGYSDIKSVRMLFDEYATSLGIDLGVDLAFQDYEKELASLPGKYAKPAGMLYLAFWNGELAGCAAFRPFANDVCEMKRLFVREKFRNCKIGAALVEKLVKDAEDCGYHAMLLDTLSSMKAAKGLYERYGFKETTAYYHNPIVDAVYYKLVF